MILNEKLYIKTGVTKSKVMHVRKKELCMNADELVLE